MRDNYALSDFLVALNAWDRHKKQYIEALERAKAPVPPPEAIENYRATWIEGFLESRAEYAEANRSS